MINMVSDVITDYTFGTWRLKEDVKEESVLKINQGGLKNRTNISWIMDDKKYISYFRLS